MYRDYNNNNLYNNRSINLTSFSDLKNKYNYNRNNNNYNYNFYSKNNSHNYDIITGLPKNNYNNYNYNNNNYSTNKNNNNINEKNQYQNRYNNKFFTDNSRDSGTIISKSNIYHSNSHLNNVNSYQYNNNNNNNIDYSNNITSSDLSLIPTCKKGLLNLGNTCFMNTGIQILIHNSAFLNDFISSNINSNPSSISNSFYSLLKNYNGNNYSSLKTFHNLFQNKHREFSNYNQNDCLEFIRIFLEDLNQELNKITIKPKYFELKQNNKNKNILFNEFNNNFKSREDSIIIDNFYGTFINSYICKNCKYQSFSFQKFLDIPLLFNNNTNNLSYFDYIKIEDLIKNNFNNEEILFDFPCENPNCKKKTYHLKETKLCHLPKILILSLQRMRKLRNKINSKVYFNENLNLNNYIDYEICNNQNCQYQLFAIANHKGSIDFGHYFAYIKINGNWFEFNDNNPVTTCYIENPSSNAYILFYSKL